ncbi:hypothetical protein ACX0G9_02870 [Flavitalea flava]
MLRILSVVLCSFGIFLFTGSANSQTYLGGGFGTFNIPGASMKFRGTGPTLKLEHIQDDDRTILYLDVSYFSKSLSDGTADIYNANGVPLGSVPITRKFSYIYSQMGGKVLLGGDADEKKIIPYIGGGVAILYKTIKTSYQSTYDLSDDVTSAWLYGFHCNAGVQYNFGPVILELRGNLDLILKPLVDDVSNVLTNLRLSASIPILK